MGTMGNTTLITFVAKYVCYNFCTLVSLRYVPSALVLHLLVIVNLTRIKNTSLAVHAAFPTQPLR